MGPWVACILLHPEAREPALAYDPAHGKLCEPLVRFLSYARAFEITSPQTYGLSPFYQLEQVFTQDPYEYPSVFSFYLPDYQPLGEILDRDLYAPELQIHNDITALSLPNAIHWLVYYGIRRDNSGGIGQRWYSQGDLDLAFEAAVGPPQRGNPYDAVLFTASDFGRTLTSDGRGSDHAWVVTPSCPAGV